MIRITIDNPPCTVIQLGTAPLGIIAIGAPVTWLELSAPPLGSFSLPVFPAVLDDNFLQAGAAFLEAGTETLSW